MPSGASLLLSWTLTFAVWLFVHAMAIVRVVRADTVETKWKWASLIPPVTAWVAWKSGFRVTAVVWASLAVLYIVLRAMG
ncbi:MAG: hypothetical protein M3Y87_03650 [Myxococcota bacterium]|nr:hypothetical protein [Myxococcota bacterium]